MSFKNAATIGRFVALAALVALLGAGCISGPRPRELGPVDDNYADFAEVAGHLDKVARDLEDFGTVSVSAAAIIPEPGDFFGFDLDLTPREIFERNRIEATSTSLDARAIGIQIAGAVDLLKKARETSDPEEAEEMREEAEAQLATAMVAASTDAGTPVPEGGEGEDVSTAAEGSGDDAEGDESSGDGADPEAEAEAEIDGESARVDVDLPTHALADSVLKDKQLSAGQPARTGPLDISLRQLIKLTFDDHTTLKLFEWLSQPSAFGLGPNQVLMAAVLNVNVRPGRLTRRGYVGEVDVRFGYGRWNGRTVVREDRWAIHPLAFAVFPALDSQVMDLRSSVRRQLAISLALQAMGTDFDAEAAFDFVRRLEQDASSVSFRNTVVGYNSGGRHFGWRFSPRFDAQGDPADEKPKRAATLEADSFPALVLILADRDDLSPAVVGPESPSQRQQRLEDCHSALLGELDEVGAALAELAGAGENLAEASARRVSDLEHRLIFLENALRDFEGYPSGGTPDACPARYDHLFIYQTMRWLPLEQRSRWKRESARLSEERIFDWAWSLEEAYEKLKSADDRLGKRESWLFPVLRNRLLMLELASLGAHPHTALPTLRPVPDPDPAQTFHGWQNRRTEIAIRGKGFKNQVKAAVIGGRLCSTSVVSDLSLVVSCDAWKAKKDTDRQHEIWLVTTRGVIRAGTIQFDRQADSGSGKIGPFASLVTRDAILGTPLVFAYAPDGLPSGRDGFALFLRPHGQVAVPWTEIKGQTSLDAAAKLLRVTYKAKTPQDAVISWLSEPRLLDVDLRLRLNPAAKPQTTLAEAVTVRYFPSEASRKLKLTATALSFTKGDDPKAESEIELTFLPTLARFREIFGLDDGDAAELIVRTATGGAVATLPVKVTADRLFVEKSEIDAQAAALLQQETKKVKLILSFGSPPTRIEVADELAISQKT